MPLTNAQITAVLKLPLSVRLALLNADPAEAGWHIGDDEDFGAYARASSPMLCASIDAPRRHISTDEAWLPSSPLTILSVASDLYSQTARGRDCWPHAARAIGRKWVLYLMATDANGESRAVVSAEDVDPLAAAVEVLREVCRG